MTDNILEINQSSKPIVVPNDVKYRKISLILIILALFIYSSLFIMSCFFNYYPDFKIDPGLMKDSLQACLFIARFIVAGLLITVVVLRSKSQNKKYFKLLSVCCLTTAVLVIGSAFLTIISTYGFETQDDKLEEIIGDVSTGIVAVCLTLIFTNFFIALTSHKLTIDLDQQILEERKKIL